MAGILAIRCASNTKPHDPDVQVTHDRSVVRPCVDLARVTTDRDGEAAETDMKKQTADLGGNVLLVYNARSGGAFYCATPLPEVTMPGASPSRFPTPLRPS
jgi:hypothetical protein